MVTSFGRVVLRKSVNPKFPVLMEKELFVANGEFLAPILEESAKEFRQIFDSAEKPLNLILDRGE